MIELLSIPVMSGLSRLHGAENNISKVVESLLFGTGAYLSFAYAHDIKLAWYGIAVIALCAAGKSMGYTEGISIGNGEYPLYKSLWSLLRKGCIIVLPLVLLSIYTDNIRSSVVLTCASLQLVIAYGVGYFVQRYMKPSFYTQKTVVGEYLGGALFGLALII